jgi:uncharacterized protein YpiB (UPF0302 family)
MFKKLFKNNPDYIRSQAEDLIRSELVDYYNFDLHNSGLKKAPAKVYVREILRELFDSEHVAKAYNSLLESEIIEDTVLRLLDEKLKEKINERLDERLIEDIVQRINKVQLTPIN